MEWGIPDWTAESNYPEYTELTQIEWWWEFLRRRDDYRKIWQKWSPINEAQIERERPMWARIAIAQGDDIEDFIQSLKQAAPTDDPDMLRDMFQISKALDPRESHNHNVIQDYRFSRVGGFNSWKPDSNFMDHESDNGRFHFCFDINEPIDPQLEKVKKNLTILQQEIKGKKIQRRARLSNWPLYLRVLDAKDSGATYNEIALQIWPGQEKTPQSARDIFEAACNLRDNFPL